jgi:Flp pilus assembly protein TadG
MRKLKFGRDRARKDDGQSLIEAALILPFLLLLLFNAINFGYYFYVAINLAQAPRDAVEYSIQGSATPAQTTFPPAGPDSDTVSVSYIARQNLTQGLQNATTSPVRVCTKALGIVNPGTVNQKVNCTTYPSGATYTFTAIVSDPESPTFLLHRVDVVYTVTPLIPAQPFGITLLPNYTFHRQVTMRGMGQ